MVDVPFDHPQAADWVLAEAANAMGYSEAHYDATGRRRVPVLKVLADEPEPTKWPLGRDDVLLVAGGGKGIAAHCAISMARETGVRLALLGRSQPSGSDRLCETPRTMAFLELVTIVVDDYDPAIDFFVDVLGFELVENSPSLTNDGRAKRWVVVRPPLAQTGILLARADGAHQTEAIGDQVAGRVGRDALAEEIIHRRPVRVPGRRSRHLGGGRPAEEQHDAEGESSPELPLPRELRRHFQHEPVPSSLRALRGDQHSLSRTRAGACPHFG